MMIFEMDSERLAIGIADPPGAGALVTLGDQQASMALRALAAGQGAELGERRLALPEARWRTGSKTLHRPPACPYCGHDGYNVRLSTLGNLLSAAGRCQRCGTRGWRWTE